MTQYHNLVLLAQKVHWKSNKLIISENLSFGEIETQFSESMISTLFYWQGANKKVHNTLRLKVLLSEILKTVIKFLVNCKLNYWELSNF